MATVEQNAERIQNINMALLQALSPRLNMDNHRYPFSSQLTTTPYPMTFKLECIKKDQNPQHTALITKEMTLAQDGDVSASVNSLIQSIPTKVMNAHAIVIDSKLNEDLSVHFQVQLTVVA